VTDDGLVIRAYETRDRDAVIALLAASLGRDDDPRFERLFAWKHEDNAFGASPGWVAVDGERVVGYRALMRWRYRRGDDLLEAVRAVDTATHPDYQGRRIFTRLTLHGIEALKTRGIAFVFNTPNAQSRPGYLKMGWEVVGRLPVSVRPRRLTSVLRIAQARVPADRWTASSTSGEPAAAVLAHGDALARLLASRPRDPRLATDRSVEYLRWRYGTDLLGYRALVASGDLEGGVVFFRVRRRGAAREAVVDDVIVPGGDPRAARAMLRLLRRKVDADYLLRIGGGLVTRDGFVSLVGQGPIFTWRAVCESRMPPLAEWRLTMGDIELF
jgi:GNAT superfamily N-acetyltransferase